MKLYVILRLDKRKIIQGIECIYSGTDLEKASHKLNNLNLKSQTYIYTMEIHHVV